MVSIVVVIHVFFNVPMVSLQKLQKRQNVSKKGQNGAGTRILENASRAKISLESKMKNLMLLARSTQVSHNL